MRRIIGLNFTGLARYHFLKKEYDKFPELYDKLNTVILFLNPSSENAGMITALDQCAGTEQVVVITPPEGGASAPDERIFLVVIDGDYLWGKFNCLHTLITEKLIAHRTDFSVANWKNYIQLQGRVYDNQSKKRFITDSLFVSRCAQQGMLRYVPVIRKAGAWRNKNQVFGHPGGYPIESLRADPSLAAKVKKILPRLADHRSRETYRTVMCGEPETLWEQYFNNLTGNPQYLDYITLKKDAVIINAGVENGFELPFFLSYNVAQIYNIDPSGRTFLHDYPKEWCRLCPQPLTFIEKALYRMEDGTDIGEDNNTTLQDIIDAQQLNRIDLIKTDIEGAERNMFAELPAIIESFRPQLAISIYHTRHADGVASIADMTDIPLKLLEICRDYNFYIGCYSYERWETIMYCIPQEIQARRALPRKSKVPHV